ncbi:hypothetical protein [Devosia sp. A16]|uniref:hypothetical protein n=1 Tax=Devosia sp. A16 TaxID=1736675 RepID=UPI0006D77042|nr:hypothetical protein [Devosia sp. A16]
MQTSSSLRFVEQGMRVFDREHHEIGKVEWVQFGEDDPETPEVEASGPSAGREDDTLVDVLARAFSDDNVPEEVRDRLAHQGFVRIDADGLFAADRYVMPEQIDSVSSDGLMLNVSKDELLKH